MSKNAATKNAVKPGLRRKRAKRSVQNSEYLGFVRRILTAYARRVAAGDVEALHSLAALTAEVDAVTRLAVVGLRKYPYHYSWSEIAGRLGVSRQGAQMRYGARTDRGALDRRLVEAGLGVTVATLVAVFAEHHPGVPAATVCPGCGYRYPDGVTDCPSNTVVRPLLKRRRNEDPNVVSRLTPDQLADLISQKTARSNRVAARRSALTPPSPADQPMSLFDLIGKDSTR
jgi:hypothetical protein